MMAGAKGMSATAMECGFCLQKDSALVDPRMLPCTHSHCMKCLKASYKPHKLIKCPTCNEVFEGTLKSVPSSAKSVEENIMCCDTCKRKGANNKPAVIYCATCTKKFCETHAESHDDLHEDHKKMSIDEFGSQAKKLKMRTCADHPDQQHIMGCRVCITLFCPKCLSGTTICSDGTPHDLLPPDDLLAELTTEINGLKGELLIKEDRLAELFKTTSKIKSNYESETEELIANIRTTRDEQIRAISVKYNDLEKELIKLRTEVVDGIARFMETNLGGQMTHLNQHRLRIEATFKQSHKVDIVAGYNALKAELERLIEDVMPELEVENIRLDNHGESRQIELAIGSGEGDHIHSDHTVTTTKSLFKSVKLLNSAQVTSPCVSVGFYQGNTYAGLWAKSVDRISGAYQPTQAIITVDNDLKAITVYQDRVYALVRGIPNAVIVYDIATGQIVSRWKHPDSIGCSSSLAVVDGKVIVPDRGNRRLVMYLLCTNIGEEIVSSSISCPIINQNHVSICAASKDSIIVSDCGSSQVSRVNINSAEVLWTTKLIAKPQGVACYGKRCVFVASKGSNMIQALNLRTGEIMDQIEDGAIGAGGNVLDLQVAGNILIVPTYSNRTVLFYQLG